MKHYRAEYKFTFFGRLDGLNEMVSANRANKFGGASRKKKLTALCAEAATAIPPVNGPVEIEFAWYEPNNRRDVDNISAGAKYLLDGLVIASRIPDDCRRYVRGISHVFPPPDPTNPRVVVTVREVA